MTAIGFSPRSVCSGAGNGAGQPLTRELGPKLPVAGASNAAQQRHQTGRSLIAQHSIESEDVSAVAALLQFQAIQH